MPTHPAHDERRLHVRARVLASATAWVGGSCKGSYLVEDLSVGGVSLSGGPAIRPAVRIKLALTLPRGSVDVVGTVLRSDRHGREFAIAVSFDPLPEAVRLAVGAAVATALEDAARESRDRPPATVLLVDDSLLARERLTRDIRTAGREVVAFSTCLDAVDFLQDPACAPIRVVLVDLLRLGDGRDLLAFLAAERPHIRRVVLVPDPADEPDRRLAPEADALALEHADAELRKPWSGESLALALAPAAPAPAPAAAPGPNPTPA